MRKELPAKLLLAKKRKEKSQHGKEMWNRFKCRVCNRWRLRGKFIRVSGGESKGLYAKVCASDTCEEIAAVGAFDCE